MWLKGARRKSKSKENNDLVKTIGGKLRKGKITDKYAERKNGGSEITTWQAYTRKIIAKKFFTGIRKET